MVTAEELIHDEKTLTTTARGKVELVHGARILLADKVIYDQRADRVVATGDVALLEPGGDILTADYVELSNQLKTGFIKNLHAFLADGSRGRAPRHTDAGQSKVMDQGVFTPCKPCEEDAEALPLWQSKRWVIHDEQARDMIYREAWLNSGAASCLSALLFSSRPDRGTPKRLADAALWPVGTSRRHS